MWSWRDPHDTLQLGQGLTGRRAGPGWRDCQPEDTASPVWGARAFTTSSKSPCEETKRPWASVHWNASLSPPRLEPDQIRHEAPNTPSPQLPLTPEWAPLGLGVLKTLSKEN